MNSEAPDQTADNMQAGSGIVNVIFPFWEIALWILEPDPPPPPPHSSKLSKSLLTFLWKKKEIGEMPLFITQIFSQDCHVYGL